MLELETLLVCFRSRILNAGVAELILKGWSGGVQLRAYRRVWIKQFGRGEIGRVKVHRIDYRCGGWERGDNWGGKLRTSPKRVIVVEANSSVMLR